MRRFIERYTFPGIYITSGCVEMRSFFTNSLFLLVMCVSAVVSGFAYHFLWRHMLINLSRPHMFFLSWALMLLNVAAGLVFEDRLIWKGLFITEKERHTVYLGRNGPMPYPISLGIMIGILSFMEWS